MLDNAKDVDDSIKTSIQKIWQEKETPPWKGRRTLIPYKQSACAQQSPRSSNMNQKFCAQQQIGQKKIIKMNLVFESV